MKEPVVLLWPLLLCVENYPSTPSPHPELGDLAQKLNGRYRPSWYLSILAEMRPYFANTPARALSAWLKTHERC